MEVDYKKLGSTDKLWHISKFMNLGLTPEEIADHMGYSNVKALSRFMNKHGYSKQGDKYILKDFTRLIDEDLMVEIFEDMTNKFIGESEYITENNKYENQMEDICPTEGLTLTMEDTCPIDVAQEDICPTISIQNQQKLLDIIDNHNSIMAIANNSDRFMKMLEKFEAMEDTCPTEVIEIVSGLQINYNKSEVIKTTVRVDKNIWNEFSNLCIDKYSQFSKIDILSQLLHEFIEKYK